VLGVKAVIAVHAVIMPVTAAIQVGPELKNPTIISMIFLLFINGLNYKGK
jgi:hypothetical protein